MEEDDKQRVLMVSLLEWTKHTPLDPVHYAAYVTDLRTRGQLSEQDLTDLLQVYADWHLPN